jgi:hypothetical protein
LAPLPARARQSAITLALDPEFCKWLFSLWFRNHNLIKIELALHEKYIAKQDRQGKLRCSKNNQELSPWVDKNCQKRIEDYG